MSVDDSRLDKRIADALVRLLPTSDWDDDLAGQMARVLGDGDAARVAGLASQLRADRERLRQSAPAVRDQVEEEIYIEWRDRLGVSLREDPDPARRVGAERVLRMLLAARGGTRGVADSWRGPGTGHRSGTGTRERRLRCEFPDNVQLNMDFGVIVRIAIAGEGALLKAFPVPPEGRDVIIDIKAPGMLVRSPYQQSVRVPADADSEPVRFELRPDRPGPARISITAWLDGNFIGQSVAEVMVLSQASSTRTQTRSSGLTAELADGAVTLLVRYDARENKYRFQFMGMGNPREVVEPMSWPIEQQIDALIERIESIVSGAPASSSSDATDRLEDEGAVLWEEFVPEQVRRQFWERRDQIKQLRIMGDEDRVPWELMYTRDQGHSAGFLVEQPFPVTRDVFERPGLTRTLRPLPARFVLPTGAPEPSRDEVRFIRELLAAGSEAETVVSRFAQLRPLISGGDFGVLHFACHNIFQGGQGGQGSVIDLDGTPFTPTNLHPARSSASLKSSAPLVFLNACRSADTAPRYNRLAGWAEEFLRAGAGAFIGSLWSVRSESAFEFAGRFYSELNAGRTVGEAAAAARREVAANRGDPTWLAYAIYGDPLARLSSQP